MLLTNPQTFNYGQGRGEVGTLGIDLREKATSCKEENDSLGVGRIRDKDISERGRMKDLRVMIMKLGAYEGNVWNG